MGTRALITIKAGSKGYQEPVLKIYKHWDGYPESLGVTILNFLSKLQFSDGARESDEHTMMCNGSEEFAAKFLEYLKGLHPDGNVYVAGIDDCAKDVNAQYDYTISIYNHFDHPNGCEIDEIEVHEIKTTRRCRIFSCSQGTQDEVIRSFGAFLHKECSKSSSMSEILRTQALNETITKEMIARNTTQVLLSEVMNNEALVKFKLSTFDKSDDTDRLKSASGYVYIPVATDELALAATEITPNNIVSELQIRVSLIETSIGSGEYKIKKVSAIRALSKTADPLSKATYGHLLTGIKLDTSDIYAAFLKADGSGKDLDVSINSNLENAQIKFAVSNPAIVKEVKSDEMALF